MSTPGGSGYVSGTPADSIDSDVSTPYRQTVGAGKMRIIRIFAPSSPLTSAPGYPIGESRIFLEAVTLGTRASEASEH